MIYGYARVSSTDQNLDRQIEALTTRDGHIRIYKDKKSGKNADRPALKELLDVLQAGDTIIVTTMDRLGRSLHDLIVITKRIQDANANLVFLKQNIDTSTAMGRLFFNILGSIAEFEREMILERQSEGIKSALARGVKFGRTPRVNVVELRRDLLGTALSTEEIKAKHGISQATVYRYMKTLKSGNTP